MNSKRLIVLGAVLIAVFALQACANTGAPAAQPTAGATQPTSAAPAQPTTGGAAQPTTASGGKKLKIGLLTSGSVNDKGWNQLAFEAVKRMEKELGAQVSNVEAGMQPSAYEKLFRDYGNQGYDVVIGHGFEYQDAALSVSKDFPNTWFLISSSRANQGNVIGLNTDSSQPFYLMGIIAAKMGKSAGLVGGIELPPIKEAFNGFINGARSVNPNFPTQTKYLGTFDDVGAGKEAALTMISGGADFVIPDADAAGNGVFQAVAEKGPSVSTFGVFFDATALAPKSVLASYVSDYGQGLIRIVSEIQKGTFKPTSNIDFGMKDTDVMKFVYNESAAKPVPADVRQLVDQAIQDLSAGKIDSKATPK